MSGAGKTRVGSPVGFIAELDGFEAASVIYLRLWCDGPEAQSQVHADFSDRLGGAQGERAFQSFDNLCRLCVQHGRRPLIRHAIQCKCLGADEACFANFIAAATEGEREDAMLIATLLVRPDVAPLIAALAVNFGIALKKMHFACPRTMMVPNPSSATRH